MTRSEYAQQYIKKNREKILAYRKEYQIKNREKLRLKKQEYYQKNKERILRRNEESRFLQRYGITLEEKKRLLSLQNNKCAICQKELDSSSRNTHMDHDHLTGKVRAILCLQCNGMLGHSRDSINILLAAIEYLKKHSDLN